MLEVSVSETEEMCIGSGVQLCLVSVFPALQYACCGGKRKWVFDFLMGVGCYVHCTCTYPEKENQHIHSLRDTWFSFSSCIFKKFYLTNLDDITEKDLILSSW